MRAGLRNRVAQAAIAAALTGLVGAVGWAYSQTNANTAILSGHEQRLNSHDRVIIEIHRDVREIRNWTRERR